MNEIESLLAMLDKNKRQVGVGGQILGLQTYKATVCFTGLQLDIWKKELKKLKESKND